MHVVAGFPFRHRPLLLRGLTPTGHWASAARRGQTIILTDHVVAVCRGQIARHFASLVSDQLVRLAAGGPRAVAGADRGLRTVEVDHVLVDETLLLVGKSHSNPRVVVSLTGLAPRRRSRAGARPVAPRAAGGQACGGMKKPGAEKSGPGGCWRMLSRQRGITVVYTVVIVHYRKFGGKEVETG